MEPRATMVGDAHCPDVCPTILADAHLDRVYRAYHVKIQNTIGDSRDYLVAHTAFVYYIDARMRAPTRQP